MIASADAGASLMLFTTISFPDERCAVAEK
jgi:hypothetical protein